MQRRVSAKRFRKAFPQSEPAKSLPSGLTLLFFQVFKKSDPLLRKETPFEVGGKLQRFCGENFELKGQSVVKNG